MSVCRNPFNHADLSSNNSNNRHNLKKAFAMPRFSLASNVYCRARHNQNLAMNDNEPKKFDTLRTVGRTKLEWLDKHKLNDYLHLVESLKTTLLTREKSVNRLHKSMFEKWTTFTNLKAILANADQ